MPMPYNIRTRILREGGCERNERGQQPSQGHTLFIFWVPPLAILFSISIGPGVEPWDFTYSICDRALQAIIAIFCVILADSVP
jgi:hypothetical protein